MEAEQFGALAGRVIARLSRHVEKTLTHHQLSVAQYRLLGLLAEGEDASSRLAEKAAVTRSSISSVVDALVSRGYVQRGADQSDRRVLPLTLTPAGTQVLAEVNVAIGERLGQIVGQLDERRARSVRTGLGDLRIALDRHRDRRLTEITPTGAS